MLKIFRRQETNIITMKKYMIGYNIPVIDTDLYTIINFGGILEYYYGSINVISAYLPENIIDLLIQYSNIKYIEEDDIATILGFPSYNITPTAEEIPWGISKIRSPEVWLGGNKGTGIKVCIIDTGIDYDHEDLYLNYKGGYNFLNNTTNPMDDNGHGTHVAGTIAAIGNNNIGVIGVAPEAHIYSLKVLNDKGSGFYTNIIAAIQWAIDNNMQIISMSLGGPGYSQTFNDICKAAYNTGIVLCAAAGNKDGTGTESTVAFPALFNSCIAIAATDSSDQRASFSSQGIAIEVSAPGVGVKSTVPLSGGKYSDPSGYKLLSGTSMATPHASGTAALILKAHSDWTNKQVRGAMTQGVVHLGDPGRNWQYGFGRIDVKACVDITSPPLPPADIAGKVCYKDCTCRDLDIKLHSCDSADDCKVDKYVCDTAACVRKSVKCSDPGYLSKKECEFYCIGKGYACNTGPGAPCKAVNSGAVHWNYSACTDICAGTCPSPTVSFGVG